MNCMASDMAQAPLPSWWHAPHELRVAAHRLGVIPKRHPSVQAQWNAFEVWVAARCEDPEDDVDADKVKKLRSLTVTR